MSNRISQLKHLIVFTFVMGFIVLLGSCDEIGISQPNWNAATLAVEVQFSMNETLGDEGIIVNNVKLSASGESRYRGTAALSSATEDFIVDIAVKVSDDTFVWEIISE